MVIKKIICVLSAAALFSGSSALAAQEIQIRADLNNGLHLTDTSDAAAGRGFGILATADYEQMESKSALEIARSMAHINQLAEGENSLEFQADLTDNTNYTIVINDGTVQRTDEFKYVSPQSLKDNFLPSLNASNMYSKLTDETGTAVMDLYCGNWSDLSSDGKAAVATYFASALPNKAEDFVAKGKSAVAAQKICDISDDAVTATANPIDEMMEVLKEDLGLSALEEYASYTDTNDTFKQILALRINNDRSRAASDFAGYFTEQYYLTGIQTSGNYSQIKPLLTALETKCGMNIASYKALNDTKSVDSALVGKSYSDAAALAAALPSLCTSQSSGGGSSSGGGGGGSKTGVTFAEPINSANTTTPSQSNDLFTDVSSEHWAYEAISVLSGRGAVSGYGDGRFCPNNNVTRAEFLTMLLRAFDFVDGEAEQGFNDVDESAWYYKYAMTGKKYGITGGYEDGSFRAENNVTRQEAVCMIANLANTGAIALGAVRESVEFTDNEQIAEYAAENVQRLYCAGVINGYEDGSFAPLGQLTRAEAAKMIFSILQANV